MNYYLTLYVTFASFIVGFVVGLVTKGKIYGALDTVLFVFSFFLSLFYLFLVTTPFWANDVGGAIVWSWLYLMTFNMWPFAAIPFLHVGWYMAKSKQMDEHSE